MRIAVFGSGAVGGYFGGRLAAAGADVTFVARGAQLDALRTNGLRIESPKGNAHVRHLKATADPSEVGPSDIVFFTVKLYDSKNAIAQILPLIGPTTVVGSRATGPGLTAWRRRGSSAGSSMPAPGSGSSPR